MTTLVHSTSTGRQDRPRPSAEPELSQAIGILLEPDSEGCGGYVTLGSHRLWAYWLSDEPDMDGRVGAFSLSGEKWDYDVIIFDDHAVVETGAIVDNGGGPPSYPSDERGFMNARAFARYVMAELIPDCLEAAKSAPN